MHAGAYYRFDPVMNVSVGMDNYHQIPYLKQVGGQTELSAVNAWIKAAYLA